jgi:drug/metabolite transporter (DMT)-like permease
MHLLLLVSLLWAFSPGLIKHGLGDLNTTHSPLVAAIRLGLTFLVFAPFLRPGLLARRTATWLACIGAIQFGLMYLLYLQAFKYLHGHEVFLFTILTPLYVVLLDGALDNKLSPRHAAAALISIVGAGLIIPRGVGTANVMLGFVLVQGANLCFAAGQIAYKRTRPALAPKATDAQLFAWLALGGFAATALVAAPVTRWSGFAPTPAQWLVLAFLGLVASGAGFFLWNRGLARVNAGTLAALNNAKIPLGVAVSLLVFREPTHLPRLLASLALLALAVWIAESDPAPDGTKAEVR